MSDYHKWEQGIVHLLNLDGWELEWTGEAFENFDAKGKTPKGFDCVVEIKIRNVYYPEKMLEKYKYDKLMQQQCLKFYYVFDSKGNYLYYLDTLKLNESQIIQCPMTTTANGNKNKTSKEVYMLTESQAALINKY